MKADKHYLTDVLVGALAGSAAGWLLPKLHDPRHEAAAKDASASTPPSLLTLTIPGRSAGSSVILQGGVADGPSLVITWRW